MKEVTDRLSRRSDQNKNDDYEIFSKKIKENKFKHDVLKKFRFKLDENKKDEKEKLQMNQWEKTHGNQRNVLIFTGRALVEILRDQTMQKSFMTLAYISDLMIGSEVTPL